MSDQAPILESVAKFIAALEVDTAYLAAPIRPPAEAFAVANDGCASRDR